MDRWPIIHNPDFFPFSRLGWCKFSSCFLRHIFYCSSLPCTRSRFTGLWVYKASLITLCIDVAEPVGSHVSPTIEFFSFLTLFLWQHVPHFHGFTAAWDISDLPGRNLPDRVLVWMGNWTPCRLWILRILSPYWKKSKKPSQWTSLSLFPFRVTHTFENTKSQS